ncbi:iron ABC transporter permease [Moraxella nasovis]|uniref:ABC transporter permease n=1 Tax=Moraxella nasovis TaxID=2904121 RepID=UPI001F60F947|nr:iron ABC transporter permease [Moraxella nasovis]UNU73095.1 iron ABC transporter permease [Moraxella nasovis]
MKNPLPTAWLLFCACLVLIPLATIIAGFSEIDYEIWQFLMDYQLPLLFQNTLFLLVTVGFGVFMLGSTTAWLTAMYRFPCRWLFSWAMMLPLAMPAYVLAFTQLGIFDYTGVINSYFRDTYGIETFLPDVNNKWGLAIVLSLTLYPYVYLLAKSAFMSMGRRSLEAGASLGLSPWRAFFKVALPMSRPWLMGGVVLALMEVLADFGAVSIFGVETFTTAIYEAWFGFFSLETAKQLASLMISFVFILLALEQYSRGNRKFHRMDKSNHHTLINLKGISKWLAFAYCGSILVIAIIIPIVQLIAWAIQMYPSQDGEFAIAGWHSLIMSLVGAIVVAAVAFLVALARRIRPTMLSNALVRIATLGYAIPGTVLAVGVFAPIAWIDNQLIEFGMFTDSDILKGTLWVMLIAYIIRFLALGLSSVSSGFERIGHNLTEAAQSVGVSQFQTARQIYLPLLKGPMGVAMMMIFVDIMKEMPLTLMTRPYDWQTLSTIIFTYTTEGRFDQAALPALLIIAAGLIPIILFSKLQEKS